MTKTDARHLVRSEWQAAAAHGLGCPVEIDDTLTDEYDWGWVFYFAPVDPTLCRREYKFSRVAIDLVNGYTTPVGTKGIEQATAILEEHRQDPG